MDKKYRDGCDDYLHLRGERVESYCKNPHVIEALGLDTIGIAPGGEIRSQDENIDYGVLTSELEGFCQICPMNTSCIEDGAEEAELVKNLKKIVKSYLEEKNSEQSQREAESYLEKKKPRSGDTTLIIL